MTEINKPDSDQAAQGEMSAIMAGVLSRFIRDEIDGMLPAEVVSYDDATNRATVKPLVMMGTTGGQKVSRATLPWRWILYALPAQAWRQRLDRGQRP